MKVYYKIVSKHLIVFGDAGNAIDGKSVVEGLPLVGTEDFKLEMKDNNEEKLKVNMVVNSMTPLYEDGSKNVINLNLVSEEFLRNEMGESRFVLDLMEIYLIILKRYLKID